MEVMPENITCYHCNGEGWTRDFEDEDPSNGIAECPLCKGIAILEI